MKTYQTIYRKFQIQLDKHIAAGGEGDIWTTDKSGFLAKIYHSPNSNQINKLKYMIKNPPFDNMLSRNHVSIAWPIDLLLDKTSNTIVGFIMPKVSNAKTLINVFNAEKRLQEAPGIDWSHLHVIAENVAIIVEAIHAKGYIIGDLKPQNLLIPEDTLYVSIVDTDSFQIIDTATANIYHCPVGTPEFTPPELYGKDLKKITREEPNDLFSLGVIIYLLLFGEHPFSGIISNLANSDLNSIEQRISQGYWPYAPISPIKRRPSSVSLDVVHPFLQQCFYLCFTVGHKNPFQRPNAAEWKKALSIGRKDLVKCDKVKNHYFSQSHGKCFWCEIKSNKNIDYFPSDQPITESPAPPPPPPSRASSVPQHSPAKPSKPQGVKILAIIIISVLVFIFAIILISIV
jgi:DNA-binding helix-hairpin-helix protein with protein kinase domain